MPKPCDLLKRYISQRNGPLSERTYIETIYGHDHHKYPDRKDMVVILPGGSKFWIDTEKGDDKNSGLSLGQAVKTCERLYELVELTYESEVNHAETKSR